MTFSTANRIELSRLPASTGVPNADSTRTTAKASRIIDIIPSVDRRDFLVLAPVKLKSEPRRLPVSRRMQEESRGKDTCGAVTQPAADMCIAQLSASPSGAELEPRAATLPWRGRVASTDKFTQA